MPEILDSLTRALDVLRLLEGADELSLSAISQQTGLSLSRTHRIMATLERSGFVSRSPESKGYRLLFGTATAGLQQSFDLVLDTAYPRLQELRDDSGETAHLSVLAGRHIYFAASVESPQVMRVTSRVGRRLPALVTAAGKVLLAQRPDEELAPLVRAQTGDAGQATGLLKQLREARRTGMARNLGESEQGMATLAVAIRTADGPATHALSISGPESRINPHRSAALTAVERRHLALLNRAATGVAAALDRH